MDFRTVILDSLEGTEVLIPSLCEIFAGWTQGEVNPYYSRLVEASHRRLESVIDDRRKLDALKSSDFAFFAATWWPKADYAELEVLLFLAIWLFTWDDEIDEPSGAYSRDLESAEHYRTQTVNRVYQFLGLHAPSGAEDTPTNKIIASFSDIGEQLVKAYSLGTRNDNCSAGQVWLTTLQDQRQRFMNEIHRFLEHTKREQQVRLCGSLPTMDEYWGFRAGTSAVGVIVAAQEYAMAAQLCPSVISEDKRMQAIAAETIINIVITKTPARSVNDLLSLKKEIAKKCIDSMIPIFCANGMSAQSAVDEATVQLKASKHRFDVAADALRSDAKRDPVKYKYVSEWIEGCQSLCTGNVQWSLATERYGLNRGIVQSNGSIQITL